MKRKYKIILTSSIIIGISIFFSVAYFQSNVTIVERCIGDTVYKDFTGEIIHRQVCIFPFTGKTITDTFLGCDEGFKQINETCIQIKQEPEPVFTGISLLNNNPEMVKRILDYCDSTGIKLSYGLRSSNGTHIITNSTCEWQTIEKYESDSNLENILDRCLHGNVGFTDEDFARWHNATHFIDTEECLMIKATHSGISIDKTSGNVEK